VFVSLKKAGDLPDASLQQVKRQAGRHWISVLGAALPSAEQAVSPLLPILLHAAKHSPPGGELVAAAAVVQAVILLGVLPDLATKVEAAGLEPVGISRAAAGAQWSSGWSSSHSSSSCPRPPAPHPSLTTCSRCCERCCRRRAAGGGRRAQLFCRGSRQSAWSARGRYNLQWSRGLGHKGAAC
jgi:hypothetical protein